MEGARIRHKLDSYSINMHDLLLLSHHTYSLSLSLSLSFSTFGAFVQAGARATEFAVKAWNSAQAYRFTDRAVRKVITIVYDSRTE